MSTPRHILKTYWGFNDFKPQQEDIITSILNGRDTVALLPTGGGKSICFQVPALLMDGICIVISPLVALMTDQVTALKNKGIKAMAIVGGTSTAELRTLLDNALYGNYKFLYLSPERLKQEMVQQAIREMKVHLFAVDEAHCISQWGNDFRPAYKHLRVIRKLRPIAPIIALTATATPEVLEDTITQLSLEEPQVFKGSFVRGNISYQVLQEDDKLYRLQQLLKTNQGSAIVYARTRSAASETSEQLNHLGVSSTFYHGGLPLEVKKQRLDDWKNGTYRTMVATSAFGMGIDHPNVRFVVHIQLPESLESYYQEAGRAGRDGDPAKAVLLYNEYDKILVRKQFVEALPTPKHLKELYKRLNNYFQIPYGEGGFTTHRFAFSEFCRTYDLPATLTFNGLNTLDRLGIISLTKEYGRNSTVQFVISSEKVLAYFDKNPTLSVVGKTLLRLYSGVFDAPTKINVNLIRSKVGRPAQEVVNFLKQMEKDQVLALELKNTDASLTFLVPREDDRTINPVAKEIKLLNNKKKDQVGAIMSYVEDNTTCRNVQLATYFGEKIDTPCGTCDVCLENTTSKSKVSIGDISEEIILLLKNEPLNSREITERLTFADVEVLEAIRYLLDAGTVGRNEQNQIELI